MTININIFNSGPTVLVNSSSIWPTLGGEKERLSLGPCSVENPLGIAILQGLYSSSSLLSSKPLILYPVMTYYCGLIRGVNHYVFFTNSDLAAINGNISSQGYSIGDSLNFSGHYVETFPFSGVYHFIRFQKGEYTVVVADEWGAAELLHFRVS